MDPYIRRCDVTKVIDGDTLRLRIDLGWNISVEQNCRLLWIDAPEKRKGTMLEALAAQEFVEDWVDRRRDGTTWPFVIQSRKSDSFGRYLVNLMDVTGAESLGAALLDAGLAEPWTP